MIRLACRVAEESHVNEKFRLILGDFKETALEEKFDVSVTLGFFDYTDESQEYLKKMKR